MTEMTTEQIKDVSVKVVEDFINNKVSLNDGIAKQASELELNPEQLKRVIEASNTIAYLKLQKEAADKTFEFPVANYEQILGKITIPEKTDSTIVETDFIAETTKTASETSFFSPDLRTQQTWARNAAMSNHYELEKLAVEGEELTYAILDKVIQLKKDEYAIEKLAEVCDEDTFMKMSILLSGVARPCLQDRVFKDNELTHARELASLYKRATELKKEIEDKKGLDKKAFLHAVTGGMGSVIGGAVGSTLAIGAHGAKLGLKHAGEMFSKSKSITAVDVAGTALSKPDPSSNVWDNLQGSQKRFT